MVFRTAPRSPVVAPATLLSMVPTACWFALSPKPLVGVIPLDRQVEAGGVIIRLPEQGGASGLGHGAEGAGQPVGGRDDAGEPVFTGGR